MCNKYFVRKQFVTSKFSVIYSLLYFITVDSWFSPYSVIIHNYHLSDAQVMPCLASGSPCKLAPVSF